jgi:copper(I)-binding protein
MGEGEMEMAMTDEAMSGMHMGGGVSAAYMTIENPGEESVRLVSVTSPVAGAAEVHESRMEGEMMQMRPVEGGLEIPAGGSMELAPGGYHIMLMELARDLRVGEAISLTLTFQTAEEPFEMIIAAPVLDAAPQPTDVIAMSVWARPTVAEAAGSMDMPMTEEAMGEMSMTEAADGMHTGGGVSAAYMHLQNRGEAADRLLTVASDVAEVVELHESRMEGEMMQMRPVEGGLEILAGGSVELAPGGYHIMLMELARDLAPGDAFTLTLTFESGATLVVGVPVYESMGMLMDD